MPPNLSTAPVPLLLTDQFGLTVPNGTNYFHSNNPKTLNTHRSDGLIGGICFRLVGLFVVMYHIYHMITFNRPQWRLRVLWRQYISPERPSRWLSVAFDGQYNLSPILGVSDSDVSQVEVGLYGSQGTTLEGTPSSGSTITAATAGARSEEGAEGLDHGLEPFPDFDGSGFRGEGGQVWMPLQGLKPGGAM